MRRGKFVFALAMLPVALVGGWLLCNYLIQLVLGLPDSPWVWNRWWLYYQALELPKFAPYAIKIKLCGAFGLGLPLLAWLGLLIPLFKASSESLHGDASFAELADLKKAGLLQQTPQSILIGKYKGQYLWLGGAQHVITVSPTRSGKTTSIAIPVLLSYLHSMVVLDLKGELRKATSGWREQQGQLIRVWAPYDDAGNTHRFNPMTTLAGMDPGKRIGEIQTIAAILYPDEPGKDPFWTSQSRAAFTAFASYMFESWDHQCKQFLAIGVTKLMPDVNTSPDFPSLERILRFSSGTDGQSTEDMLQSIVKDPARTFISPQTRTVFGNLAGLAEQTFSSVIATMQAPLQQFLSPVLAAATNATDFDITALRKHPTTLYVDIPTNKLDESGKLLNIFFSSVIGNNLGKQLPAQPQPQLAQSRDTRQHLEAGVADTRPLLRDFSDPSHPQNALYNTLKEGLPARTAPELLSHATAACYKSGIKQPDDLGPVVGREGTLHIFSRSLFSVGTTVDVTQPAPSVQQTMEQVQQFDQQRANDRAQAQAQNAAQANQRQGPTLG